MFVNNNKQNYVYDISLENKLLKTNNVPQTVLEEYITMLTEYSCNRPDYLQSSLVIDNFPQIMKIYGNTNNLSYNIIIKINERLEEMSNFLRIHDALDFSCYLAQVVYQTIGNIEEFQKINDLMINLSNSAKSKCYSLVKNPIDSKLLELIEPVIDTISGIFIELKKQLNQATKNLPRSILDKCAEKVYAEPEPEYLHIIDDVFDYSITASNNFEYIIPQFIEKRNKMISEFVKSYLVE